MFAKKPRYITGLDIGTTKICAIIGELDQNNELKIIGFGTNPSNGLKKGIVIDIEETVKSIQNAMWKAEEMAGIQVKEVFIGIAGCHITSMNHKGVTPVTNPDRGIVESDIRDAHEKAKAISIPSDREIINYFPQEYIIDDDDGIKNPLGMSGHRLEVKMHIVTANVASVNNIKRSVEQAGYKWNELLLESLASGYSTLSDSEKELGVLLLDIGGGTSDFAIFRNHSVRFSSVIPFGGDNVTNDISYILRISKFDAENLKKVQGCAYMPLVDDDEEIEIRSVFENRTKRIKKKYLAEVIQARTEEIFNLTKKKLDESKHKDSYMAGVVLTGGSSLMKGMPELAEEIFGVPVKIGLPQGLKGITSVISSPIYSTGVGLVLYGQDPNKEPVEHLNYFGKFLNRLKNFFEV